MKRVQSWLEGIAANSASNANAVIEGLEQQGFEVIAQAVGDLDTGTPDIIKAKQHSKPFKWIEGYKKLRGSSSQIIAYAGVDSLGRILTVGTDIVVEGW